MEETISTLRFANRMMRVSNEVVINVELDPGQLVERYKREIRDLKQELAMHDTLMNRGRVVYEPYTPDQQYLIQQTVEKFLDGDSEDIEIESLRQAKEIFNQIRNAYRKGLTRLGVEEFKGRSRPETHKTGTLKGVELKGAEDREDGVGQEENAGGFGIGRANPNARPADSTALEAKILFQQEEENDEKRTLTAEEANKYSSDKGIRKQPLIDKNQAFMEFKNGDGREIENNLAQNREDLKDRKYRLKVTTSEVNRIKKGIDDCKEMLDNIRRDRVNDDEGVIDEEEFAYIKRMKDYKKIYRVNFDQMKALKEEISAINQNLEYARENLISEFEIWYEKKFGIVMPKSNESLRKVMANVEEPANEELDLDAIAYIKAKKNVYTLHKAKKNIGKA